jgi:hypothetical protein
MFRIAVVEDADAVFPFQLTFINRIPDHALAGQMKKGGEIIILRYDRAYYRVSERRPGSGDALNSTWTNIVYIFCVPDDDRCAIGFPLQRLHRPLQKLYSQMNDKTRKMFRPLELYPVTPSTECSAFFVTKLAVHSDATTYRVLQPTDSMEVLGISADSKHDTITLAFTLFRFSASANQWQLSFGAMEDRDMRLRNFATSTTKSNGIYRRPG